VNSQSSYHPFLDQIGNRSDLNVDAPVADAGHTGLSVDCAGRHCGALDGLALIAELTTAVVVVVVGLKDA